MQKYFCVAVILSVFLFASSIKDEAQRYLKDPEINNILKDIQNKSQKAKIFKNINKQTEKVPYIFYFYSSSMGIAPLKNFIELAYPLKKRFKNLKLYIVFRGFPKKEFFIRIRKKIYQEKYKNLVTFKFHPIMFRYFNLDRVPAYVFAKCSEDFRFNKCDKEHSYLARGDFSLYYFFNILYENNKKEFEKYLDFINGLQEKK